MYLQVYVSILYWIFSSTLSKEHVLDENSLKLIKDYVSWRKVKHIIFVNYKIKSGISSRVFQNLVVELGSKGVYTSTHSSINTTDAVFKKSKHHIAVATFMCDDVWEEELKHEASTLAQYGEKISWIIMLHSYQSNAVEYLRYSPIALNSDIVVALERKQYPVVKTDRNDTMKGTSRSYVLGSHQSDIYLPYLENNNGIKMNLSFCDDETRRINGAFYCMIQVYKIRKGYNTSLALYALGPWTALNGTKLLRNFLSVEKRSNFHKLPLLIGHNNGSKVTAVDEMSVENDDNDYNMGEFFNYFSCFLNSSISLQTYSQLGSKGVDGEWSDLFGDIVDGNIDITYDCVIKTLQRSEDMSFTYDVLLSMRNIYIQTEESSDFRDIFLEPFDSRLILCVIVTGVMFAIGLTIINKISYIYRNMDMNPNQGGFVESLVWCVGVFSQQGSIFRPKFYSDQIVVLIALAFTLLIYNSYSAFITSVLSVTLPNIRTVDDLLNSDYEIGYVKNSQDEVYLRLMNVSQLNEIYLRGYLNNDVGNITEGLLKVTKGNYGFFASGQVARRQLLNISHYRCMYDVDEIPIKYTKYPVAFALAKKSPFKRLINLSIIRMFESGIYKYLAALIYPGMPKCKYRKTFQSAGLTDLSTAFFILLLGHIFGIVLMILECAWMKRKKIYSCLKTKLSTNVSKQGRPPRKPKFPFTL